MPAIGDRNSAHHELAVAEYRFFPSPDSHMAVEGRKAQFAERKPFANGSSPSGSRSATMWAPSSSPWLQR
jgi:hypothetical protein